MSLDRQWPHSDFDFHIHFQHHTWMPSLNDVPRRRRVAIERVAGERAFRRRLLEMGLVVGVEVQVLAVAPLGDPLELEVRGGRLSIRRREASMITVRDV